MIKFYFSVCLFFLSFELAQAQETDSAFKGSIFKNTVDELPYSIAIGGGIGPGSKNATGGLVVESDLYHILGGFRLVQHGILVSDDYKKAIEYSGYLGYQYRSRKFMASLGAGYGLLKYECSFFGSSNGNCFSNEESKINCIPLKLEVDFVTSMYFALGISMNGTITNQEDLYSLLFCLKFGIFREGDY